MECLNAKISKVQCLWTSLGLSLTDDSIAVKLEHVFYELDRLLEYEELQKRLLCADIEDLMASIEESCTILGLAVEHVLSSGLCEKTVIDSDIPSTLCNSPTFPKQKALIELDSRLLHEIRQRRLHIKGWLHQIRKISAKLGEPVQFKSYKEYYNDLSWGTVQSISCALRDLLYKEACRQRDFDRYAANIQFYWKVLDVSPDLSDPLEASLHDLFSGIEIGINEHMEPLLPSDLTYYALLKPGKHQPLRSGEAVSSMAEKAEALRAIYETRLELYNKYVKSITIIWKEIKVPMHRRSPIMLTLSEDYLNKLHVEFDELKTIVRNMANEYIDKFREKLEDLWNKALLTKRERVEFIARLHEKADTMDEVHRLVNEHIEYLKRVQPKATLVAKIMKNRNNLIQEMIEFEKAASDPKRLFQASFQLVEEERWRNSCFPNLLQLDEDLFAAVRAFEEVSGKPFIYGQRRYLDTLRDEIADRAANQTFFGFLKSSEAASLKNNERRTKPRVSTNPSSTTFKRLSSKARIPSPSVSTKTQRSAGKIATTRLSREATASPASTSTDKSVHLDNQQTSKMPPTPPVELSMKKDYISKKSRIPYCVADSEDSMSQPQRRRWSGSSDIVTTCKTSTEKPKTHHQKHPSSSSLPEHRHLDIISSAITTIKSI
ncbi:microtubule associated protein-domain-containing protein [Dichotomocladium elegans]|nr:microtubule associated protein-domain-containing protein [Dichotomocladium elegans]